MSQGTASIKGRTIKTVRPESVWSRVLPSLTARPVSRANYERLRVLLENFAGPRRVLVIGGATVGSGMEPLLRDPSVELVEVDYALGPRTRYLADAHDLPFADASFDGVVLQAVLEHVADPARVVAEAYRVLRPGGLVYAETAFMQQVHAGASDFTRFTELGHRRLFRGYREIERGAACGPGTALAWSYQHFLVAIAGQGRRAKAAVGFARLTGFWLKYIDYLVRDRPAAVDGASSVYFLGAKAANSSRRPGTCAVVSRGAGCVTVSVVLEQRYLRLPDGSVWTPGPFAAEFFERYLRVFDRVNVVARVMGVAARPASARRLDGHGVTVCGVEHYVGPAEYVLHRGRVMHDIQTAMSAAEAVVLRAPSQLANLAESIVKRRALPYALEVVGDPADVFAAGACSHPLRRWFRRKHVRRLRAQCASAPLVSYVTREALQRSYPACSAEATTHYSSVELPDKAFYFRSQQATPNRPVRLVTVGSLDHRYKGVDTLIEAVALLGEGYATSVVGGGREQAALERLACRLGVAVRFVGQLASGTAVREELDRADVFVLASRQEGLPRALIEAMARSLPCVATSVGGCDELLGSEWLVKPDSPRDLANAVLRLLPVRTEQGRNNYERAREYADSVLQPRRDAFLLDLRRTAMRQVSVGPSYSHVKAA